MPEQHLKGDEEKQDSDGTRMLCEGIMFFYDDWGRHTGVHRGEQHRTRSVLLYHLIINFLTFFKSLKSLCKKYLL